MSNQEIRGQAKKVRDLLNAKYSVDYYQREYKWETKQIQELIDDLTSKFLEDWSEDHARSAVQNYGHYFLGSIIISSKDEQRFIVDGQQRLTSLTLLLIFLRHLQKDLERPVKIDDLIYSERYGEISFNLDVPKRLPAMDALFKGEDFDPTGHEESVQTIAARYRDIQDLFPEEVRGPALPFFIDWLVENVHLVEITAFSDEEAYTIFETMNDRGLSLTPTEMLKGYLLANITDETRKTLANEKWRKRTQELTELGKETEADFFKAWLRSQYATKIRERKKNAKAEDFDRIGTEFHRWVREHSSDRDGDLLTIHGSDGFYDFIAADFDFYSRQYMRILQAGQELTKGLEHVFYLSRTGFTHYPMVMLAPLTPADSDTVVLAKMRLVATYIDMWWARRIWNYKTIGYSATQYSMFNLMRDVRGLYAPALARRLYDEVIQLWETFDTPDASTLRMHQQNSWQIHLLLARLTDWCEQQSEMASRYVEYVTGQGNQRYEVEHIWADIPERHIEEFPSANDFRYFRNRLGGLLLLPKLFNASFGKLIYEEKVSHYLKQNLLAASLNEAAYDRNPGFARFREQSGLPFRPMPHFGRAELEERQVLYREIAKQVWNPELLLAGGPSNQSGASPETAFAVVGEGS